MVHLTSAIIGFLLMISTINAQNNDTNSSSSTGSDEEPLRCVPLNVDGAHCAGYVNYLVPSDVNQSIAVLYVQAFQNWQATNDCPFYGNLQYQCYKWFPLCVNNSGVADVQLLCQSLCYGAKTYSDGLCSSYVAAYFDAECLDSSHYSSSSCRSPELRLSPYNAAESTWWKWLLAGICIAVGLVIAVSVFRRWYRNKKISPELTDEDIRRDLAGPAPAKRTSLNEYAKKPPNPKREAVFQAVVAQGGR